MRSALQTRRSLSIAREEPLNVFDLAAALGVDVRFMDLPSLEGMFLKEPHPVVILPSLKHRPRGRVAFSCAHELGHFQLGHGTQVDRYLSDHQHLDSRSAEEIAADTFASTILMPRPAVLARFCCRSIDLAGATPRQVFQVANELGVGYSTLVRHLTFGLELVTAAWFRERDRESPKSIRAEILGCDEVGEVQLLDQLSPLTPVDLEVGDVLGVPMEQPALSNSQLLPFRHAGDWQFYRAALPGRCALEIGSRKFTVRVARDGFCGDWRYRYLSDPDIA